MPCWDHRLRISRLQRRLILLFYVRGVKKVQFQRVLTKRDCSDPRITYCLFISEGIRP